MNYKFFIGLMVFIGLTGLASAETWSSERVSCGSFNCSNNWSLGSGFRIITASNLSVFSSIYYPNSSTLSQNISTLAGEKYKITLNVSSIWFNWHNFYVGLGGSNSSVFNSTGNYTFYLYPTNSNNLTIYINRTYNQTANANVIFKGISAKQDLDYGAVQVNFSSPTLPSGLILTDGTLNIIVNVTISSTIQNITYNLYNSSGLINSTILTSIPELFVWDTPNDDTYFYNVSVIGITGLTSSTETRNLTIEYGANVTMCRTLNRENMTYFLNDNIITNDLNCISMDGQNVSLNGNNYSLTNGGFRIGSDYCNECSLSNLRMKHLEVKTMTYSYLLNNYISNCSSECIVLGNNYAGSYFNLFKGTILNNSSGYGIFFNGTSILGLTTGVSNNIFQDTTIINISNYNIYMPTISEFWTVQYNNNNTFLNCSYDSEYVSGTANQLIRQWYYQASVNDSNGNIVVGANITAYNSSGQLQFSLLTDSDGKTSGLEGITDYVNNAGTKTYYSNYTIHADYEGYQSEHTYNSTLNQNYFDDTFILSCWTKTGTGRGSILFIPRGCVFSVLKGVVYG